MSQSLFLRIVTDSTSDLPEGLAERYGIEVIPCYINIGDQSYLDGIQITREAFYRNLPDFNNQPQTSSPGVGVFKKVYEKLADEGAKEILSMHIHSGLSNLSNTARLAANESNPVRVTVMECGQLAIGLGFLVLAAAMMALKGSPTKIIIDKVKEMEARTYVYAALDTMTFLKKSGRAPGLLVEIANLLSIKPIIQLHEGNLQLAGQVRTYARIMDRLEGIAKRLEPLQKIAVMHTHAPQRAEHLATRLAQSLSIKQKIMILEATPVFGVHLGPGAVGMACIRENMN